MQQVVIFRGGFGAQQPRMRNNNNDQESIEEGSNYIEQDMFGQYEENYYDKLWRRIYV